MSQINEQSQDQEERENLSGLDDYQEWIDSMEKDAAKKESEAVSECI